MSDVLVADRLATSDEVVARGKELRALAKRDGFEVVMLASAGILVVHSDEPGYKRVAKFAGNASRLVGAYVQVITDDVPAASAPTTPL